MALRKAVLAEALDLVEAALGKLRVVAPFDHAPDHLALELFDRPAGAEGRHGLAQLVRLRGAELGRVDGDLHRLFLEDRNPLGPPQNALEFVRIMLRPRLGVDDLFLPAPPPEVGMNHVALDRARADDGDLDHEIVELPRFQPRQHVHLRPALHLEGAQTVPLAEHVIDRRILLWHAGKIVADAVMGIDQVEGLFHTGEHAERQHIHLQDAELVDIVLVPFDEAAVGHGAVADGHGLGELVLGQDEAAHMLAEMPRHADHLIRKLYGAGHQGILEVKPGLLGLPHADLLAPASPDRLGQGGGDILRQAHDLAHLPHRHARAVVDDRGAEPGPVAPVFLVDVLDHQLPPFVFEIHVAVRGLLALLADETFEQEVVLGRVHGGDAEHVADSGVRGRAPPLAQDRRVDLVPCELDHVMDGQEILGDVELADHGELLFQHRARLVRHAVRVMLGRAPPGKLGEVFLGCAAPGQGFLGVFVGEFPQVEGAGIRHLPGGPDRVRPVGEKADHLIG